MPVIPFHIEPSELQWSAMRAQGAGGQHVNKVSSAVLLRYSTATASLPEDLKERIRTWPDQRITAEGDILIKAQEHRAQEQNRADALERLQSLLKAIAFTPRRRKPTHATRASQQRRLDHKSQRGEIKKMRQRMGW